MAITRITNIANTLPDDSISNSKLQDIVNFKNIIINGDMSIAQRGTSQATAGSGGGSYQTLDRYKFFNNSLGGFTWSQDTDVPSGQGFAKSMKFDCTTADATPAAGDYLIFGQDFEGQNLQYLKKGTANAESLTLSFWVKSVKTGTFIVELADNDNTRQISKSYTINSASTWEKKTITFAGDTTGTLDNDNGSSLAVQFWLATGSDYSSGTLNTSWNSRTNANRAVGQVNLADDTANNFWITGVQLEAGTTASDFEFLPVDVNLNRCMRYYQRQNPAYSPTFVRARSSPANAYLGSNTFSVIMRASPTVTLNFASNAIVKDGIRFDSYTLAATSSNNNSWGVIIVPGIDDSNNYHAYGNGGYIEASAEL